MGDGLPKGKVGSGMTALIISNKKLEDIIKIFEFTEKSGLLIKGVNETIDNKAKEQKEGFFGLLLGILGASLFGNLLANKGVISAGKETIIAGQDF